MTFRVGSGGWIETMYPSISATFKYSYWAFDSDALRSNPVPAWCPGQASPNDAGMLLLHLVRREPGWYIAQMG